MAGLVFRAPGEVDTFWVPKTKFRVSRKFLIDYGPATILNAPHPWESGERAFQVVWGHGKGGGRNDLHEDFRDFVTWHTLVWRGLHVGQLGA